MILGRASFLGRLRLIVLDFPFLGLSDNAFSELWAVGTELGDGSAACSGCIDAFRGDVLACPFGFLSAESAWTVSRLIEARSTRLFTAIRGRREDGPARTGLTDSDEAVSSGDRSREGSEAYMIPCARTSGLAGAYPMFIPA